MDPENILENSLIPSIIEGDSRKTEQIAAKLNIDISSIGDVLLLYPLFDKMDAKKRLQLLRALVKEMRRCAESLHREILVDIYDSYIICFIIDSPAAKMSDDGNQAFYEELTASVNKVYDHCVYTVFPVDGKVSELPASYQLCDKHLPHAMAIFPQKKSLSYSDILFSKYCWDALQQRGETYKILQHIIDQLTEAGNHDELLNTLEVFHLDAECEIKKTAQLMYVHRNTIQYRLNRVRAITRTRANDLMDAYLLRSAIGCYRLARSL